jgi:Zn-dependent protease with chaperone function
VNFFEHQDQARRNTRWLLFLFLMAVLAIVAVIDFAVLVVLGSHQADVTQTLQLSDLLAANRRLLIGVSCATLLVIGLASAYRIVLLKTGGGQVAEELGGTALPASPEDPLHQRLRNVVEEIALASGVPVPEIYVLEYEQGINAFAAGFTPADAAVAVTRGALEKLSRSELQGVIAHEFSHVFNGDMRLNIRLMGALFGILVLAVAGRRILFHTRYARSRNKEGMAIVLLGAALMVAGYVGLFFGRWIKSAVSRQREYLADASAVQFTRDPESIGGALKKIAVHTGQSHLTVDSEEVGHMLFGAGTRQRLFASHPPLMKRIKRINPGFEESQLSDLLREVRREEARSAERAERAGVNEARAASAAFDPAGIVDEIGQPGWERITAAAALMAALPDRLRQAAHSPDWAFELMLAILLDRDTTSSEEQLLIIASELGTESEQRVRQMRELFGSLDAQQRLPILEMALPTVKKRSKSDQTQLLKVITRISAVDGKISPFEYLVARLIRQYLWDAANPRRAGRTGRLSIQSVNAEVCAVLAVLAHHGHSGDPLAEEAFNVGMETLPGNDGQFPAELTDWDQGLDAALDRLDDLNPKGREQLVGAMLATVSHDDSVRPEEIELARAVCAALHVPVPIPSH